MDKVEKYKLTMINKIEVFNKALRKLTITEILTPEEKSYILSCAIIFIKHYESDRRFTSYLELGYYIILKYSITYNDYQPLYDFSINFGFYPIAKEIMDKELLSELSLNDSLLEIKIINYKHKDHIETYEQNKIRNKIIEDNSINVSYIAPTSFGKSAIVIEHILRNNNNKVGIIVPTKSLLIQTYRTVKESGIDRRVLIHDEMYQGDDRFIAILTQERALRLFDKHNVSFDILYIDEAHNLFDKDSRSILLSRLIRKNIIQNPQLKTMYLSPLINNSNNLKIDQQEEIIEQRISHNIKEPEIFEYRLTGEVFQYNRFVNEFYQLDFQGDYLTYIKDNQGLKNFIYIRNPRKIEMFAKEIASELDETSYSQDVQDLISELEEFVHRDFYIIDLLSKCVVYLHGKMPDIVKEYLEYKFKEINMLNFIVANTVILEGINLPIDSLFILNTHDLRGKGLTNLIGRVNRLDKIFNGSSNQLHKLLPPIHFINNEFYGRPKSKMEKKIELLRSNVFEDEIENPILSAFDIDKLTESNKEKINKIIESEELIFKTEEDEVSLLKRYFINSGIEKAYHINDRILAEMLTRMQGIDKLSNDWVNLHIVDKIYEIFIHNFSDSILDYEFSRLSNVKARSYYKLHMFNSRNHSLKETIQRTFNYFKERIKLNDSMFYIGETYGEISRDTEYYSDNRGREVYVDLSSKTDSEIINLTIVKLKIEDDFISYKLNKMIVALFDYDLITEEEYNQVVYGTNDSKKISLIKTGLSINLISRLQTDNQLINLNFDDNNNLITNSSFDAYRNSIKGFYRFELDKFL